MPASRAGPGPGPAAAPATPGTPRAARCAATRATTVSDPMCTRTGGSSVRGRVTRNPVLEHVDHLDVHPPHRHPQRLLAGGDHHLAHPRGHRGQVDAEARGDGDRDVGGAPAPAALGTCSIRQLRARTPDIRSTACRSTAAAAGRLSRAGPCGEASASRSCGRNSVRTAPPSPAPAPTAAARAARRPSGAPAASQPAGVGDGRPAVRAAALVLVGRQPGLGAVPDQRRVPAAGQRRDRAGRRSPIRASHRHARITSASRTRARWIRPRTASSLGPGDLRDVGVAEALQLPQHPAHPQLVGQRRAAPGRSAASPASSSAARSGVVGRGPAVVDLARPGPGAGGAAWPGSGW